MLEKNSIKNYFMLLGVVLIISLLCVISLELGDCNTGGLGISWLYLNVGTIFFSILFFSCFIRRYWISTIIHIMLCTLVSIVNYYVIIYRGVPVSFSDLQNLGTAANVLGGYKIFPCVSIYRIMFCFVAGVFLVMYLRHIEMKQCSKKGKVYIVTECLAILICSTMFFYTGFCSGHALKPHDTFTWSWSESYHQYGYLASTMEVFGDALNPVKMPESYDETQLSTLPTVTNLVDKKEYPDIILILNETYYDIDQLVNIITDCEYMEFYHSLDNSIKGHVIVPQVGGGTNNSEYELLTSNSLQLAPQITPFNVLNLQEANSIVSFLKQYKYTTVGMHPAPAANYSRSKAYHDLGFDDIYFEDDFSELTYYQNRKWFPTDQSAYKTMLQVYERLPEDHARFLYLLTLQNHGGWDINDADVDIVHISEDFGEYTEQMNEFLSCMRLSDLALKELIQYYSQIERPVIICMVGDHCPAFLNSIVDESQKEINLKLHSTPFLIWANFPIEEKELGYVGLNTLVPNLLKIADIPLSYYYQYILELQEQVSILTCI